MNFNPLPAKPRVPSPAMSIFAFLLVAVGFNALGFLLSGLLKWPSIWVSAAAEITVVAAVPLVLALIMRYDFKTTFLWRRLDAKMLALCVLLGLATQFAVRFPDLLVRWFLQFLLGPLYLPEGSQISDGTVGGMLLASLALLVLAPLCEELLNRGFLMAGFYQNGQRRFWSTVLFVGLFFGLFHQYMYTFTGTALGGLVLAYVALTSGSIWASIATHFGFNLFPATVYWVLLFVKDKNGQLFGENLKETGLQRIELDLVLSSLVITFFGAALMFFLLRGITRLSARNRTGLEIAYQGLVKEIHPDSPYQVAGEFYGPGWPYLYGYQGYVTEEMAPDYWQAPGINKAGLLVGPALQKAKARPPATVNGQRYLPPQKRPVGAKPKFFNNPHPATVVTLVLVLMLFAFTSFVEVRLRARGTDCEAGRATCATLLPASSSGLRLVEPYNILTLSDR